VAQAVPNDDGPSNADQDFVAQGAGNLAASLVGGMPVGGSVSQTALNVAAGGRTRWAAIWSGLWLLIILLALSSVVGKVAVPTLAAGLVFAGLASLRPREIATILRTGPNSQIALISTFTATLLLPVAAAVGIGVVISLLLQLNQEAIDLCVVQLAVDDEGRFVERGAPRRLPNHEITVLDVYGSLFYAGARTLQARLPDPTGAQGPVVVLRLRGRTTLGATFFSVASGYAERLARVGGRLYLTGLDPQLAARLRASGGLPLTGDARFFEATPVIGESTSAAVDDATTWLVERASRES
jgi:SulP family sulfate permease